MPELDRRLPEVSQLRKLRRAFRDPQERLEDERLARGILENSSSGQDLLGAYGRPVIRAVIRHWWCRGECAAMIELGERLDAAFLDEEPLLALYLEEAKARLPLASS